MILERIQEDRRYWAVEGSHNFKVLNRPKRNRRIETPSGHGFKPDSPVETTLPISLLFLASNSVTFSGIDSGIGNGGSPSVH